MISYLLELSLSDESINPVTWSGGPANAVVGVEVDTLLSLFFRNELQAVIIDENVR